jgi:flagellar biosynthetic protein FliQ
MDLPSIATEALRLAITLSLPALLACLALGLVLSFFELVSPGQDPSLSFVPRLLAVAVVWFVGREFLSAELVHFTSDVFHRIAQVRR